ncbi:MAG TPA: hypothetical protein VKU01_33940 [Bryobacteraceae bacterium]|nr:hypothetical protein [Bryobacteraceae bacterium]
MYTTETREIGIGRVLDRQLRRVEAPEELWRRIQAGRVSPPRPFNVRIAWALAAMVPLLAVAWTLRVSQQRLSEIRCGDASEMRSWIRAKTGLDVPLQRSASLRLESARVLASAAVPAVEITYHAGDRTGTLRVSKAAGRRAAGHKFVSRDSWVMSDQAFVIDCPGDPRAGCTLCHAL